MIVLTILLLILDIISCQDPIDYCDICENHIGCNNTGDISDLCEDKAKLLELKESGIIDLFVHLHNKKRNKIALGLIPNFKPAVRMPTMSWNNELAKLAELNVKTCLFQHDKCRNTIDFKYSGQNLAYWGHYELISPAAVTFRTVKKWFDEYNIANMSVIRRFQASKKESGHFTVMVSDRNTHLGCAILKQYDIPFRVYTIACNYATNNLNGLPIYKSGDVTASECTTGTNNDYPGLCSISEVVDPNPKADVKYKTIH